MKKETEQVDIKSANQFVPPFKGSEKSMSSRKWKKRLLREKYSFFYQETCLMHVC